MSLQVPFSVLQGEGVEYLGRADEAIIAISNYRLHIKFKDSVINVSLHCHDKPLQERVGFNGRFGYSGLFSFAQHMSYKHRIVLTANKPEGLY